MITSNNGFFDKFGGKYVAEIIRRPLDDLEAAFNKYIHDRSRQHGRPQD